MSALSGGFPSNVAYVMPATGSDVRMASTTGSDRRSAFPPLLASVLLLGIADSVIGPYLVLFAADQARLSPLRVGVFLSLISVSGLLVSTWLGRRYDRSASRWPPSSPWRPRRRATWR
jgi:hypothetical protein